MTAQCNHQTLVSKHPLVSGVRRQRSGIQSEGRQQRAAWAREYVGESSRWSSMGQFNASRRGLAHAKIDGRPGEREADPGTSSETPIRLHDDDASKRACLSVSLQQRGPTACSSFCQPAVWSAARLVCPIGTALPVP
jgi:hypothetical protein